MLGLVEIDGCGWEQFWWPVQEQGVCRNPPLRLIRREVSIEGSIDLPIHTVVIRQGLRKVDIQHFKFIK